MPWTNVTQNATTFNEVEGAGDSWTYNDSSRTYNELALTYNSVGTTQSWTEVTATAVPTWTETTVN